MKGKLYYSISEVSSLTDLEASVLRFWESEFSQLRPKKNRAGIRMYREKDIRLIQGIKRLTRDEGYTLAGAKKQIQESFKPGAEPIETDAPSDTENGTNLLQWVRSELMSIHALLP